MSEFGKRVRIRRKELGLSQRKLADELGVTKQYVSKFELGLVPLIKLRDRLCEILQIGSDVESSLRPKKKRARGKGIGRSGTLGAFLHARRRELNIPREEITRRTGISRQTIARAEADYVHNPEILQKIVEALQCEVPTRFISRMRKTS